MNARKKTYGGKGKRKSPSFLPVVNADINAAAMADYSGYGAY